MSSWIQLETNRGSSVKVGQITLTPFATSLLIGIPRANVGFVWNRPASVLVQIPNGEERVLPVIDVTRRVIWTIWGAALIFVLLVGLFRSRD